MAHDTLTKAKKTKNDEFYTQYSDIEKEINAYIDFDANVFRDKTVLLPCDDPEWSNFTKYFVLNFKRFGLKKLISTSYASKSKQIPGEYRATTFERAGAQFDAEKSYQNGKIFTLTADRLPPEGFDTSDLEWRYLDGDGDFRSDEIKALRDEADIVVTNPPFSLFREFLSWLFEAKRQFLVIGNLNAITYVEAFSAMKGNTLWLGATNFNRGMYFKVPEYFEYASTYKFEREQNGVKVSRVPSVCWFTNMEHGRRHQPLPLMSEADVIRYSTKKPFQKYDNYDAIEVASIKDIPGDYYGVMGVPISFMDKYCPEQFEIIGSFNAGAHAVEIGAVKTETHTKGKVILWNGPVVNKEPLYKRILIRRLICKGELK